MAKEVDGSHEPSQSSSALPPLADNEVELVIERFWRDTRPRVCVRSETKQVNGFNFRLLVWPQGSKQSQSHLSAFVEVVPPSVGESKKEAEEKGIAAKRPYPPDWACPCVFYRISVMNFKQKYPYSKADTWTFSYVCPDRGWHTLLDTRYINRRDGYLSNEGSLVIRAIAFPRFGHAISVLPLLSNIGHGEERGQNQNHYIGLANFMATDHVNCLVQSLYHLPGFRKVLYSLRHKSSRSLSCRPSHANLEEAELEVIEQGLQSCADTIKEIMTRVSNASPEVARMIHTEFVKDCIVAGLCGVERGKRAEEKLIFLYGRCKVLINCLDESLFSVSQSLFGRKRSTAPDSVNKRTQFEAYRQIVRECKRILSTVVQSLFLLKNDEDDGWEDPKNNTNLIEELQLVFAKLEIGGGKLIDTRGLLRELGVTCGGILSQASPDGLYVVFYEALRKAALEMVCDGKDKNTSPAWEEISKILIGSAVSSSEEAEEEVAEFSFSHLRLSNHKATSVEKHIASWAEQGANKFSALPAVLTLQFLHKVKDRLDVTERMSLEQFCVSSLSAGVEKKNSSSWGGGEWMEFLDHDCVGKNCPYSSSSCVEKNIFDATTSGYSPFEYRLHSILFSSGSDLSTGHYSTLVRNHRLGGWTRFDDAFAEDLIDVSGVSCPSSSSLSCPDWVFSPEWSCCSATFVKESAVDLVYQRGVDVRLLRPEIFSRAMKFFSFHQNIENPALLCNRLCPLPAPSSALTNLDASCQVEVCLITEKDVLAACPGGFNVPFSFSVPNVSRKLIVRKDIAIERLMQAVNEHFKIPVQLQRLLALRYYPETSQERFELMQANRAVLGYLPLDSSGKERSHHQSSLYFSSQKKSPSTIPSQLYVLVSASRRPASEITVWVKVLDEKRMGVLSVCLLSVDPNEPLRSYFDQVAAKAGSKNICLPPGTQFIVFEEVSVRQVEIKRSSSAMKLEKIMDGDILIFVPLTDSCKRSLIAPSSLLAPLRAKRRILSAHQALKEPAVEENFSADDSQDDDEECASDLNERCKQFLSKADEEEEKEGIDDEEASHHRLDIVRRYLRRTGAKEAPKLADIMSDIMREFGDNEEEEISSVKRRLEVPVELKEELSRVAATLCFYCQLPLGARPCARVSCSAKCVNETLTYHARCVQELVSETGTSVCVITEGCTGKISVEPKSIVAKLITREEIPPRLSLGALRAKVVNQLLEMPQIPQVVAKTGQIVYSAGGGPVQWKGRGKVPPPLPASIKVPSSKKLKKALPVEPLWWNALLIAFGGIDNLHTVASDGHWDAAELTEAKNIFYVWCKSLLEKLHPKRVPPCKPLHHQERDQRAKKQPEREEQEGESSSSSSSSEEEEREKTCSISRKASLQLQFTVQEEAGGFSLDDEDESGGGFILVGASCKKEKRTTPLDTPTESSAVVIPQGFLGNAAPSLKPPNSPLLVPPPSFLEEPLLPETCSLLQARINLLPMLVRQYCLPVQLVFVYYSEEFFKTLPDHDPTTVSVIPPPGAEEEVKRAIASIAFKLSLSVNRLFTSPHQTSTDSAVAVQWFVDFASVDDAHRFTQHVSSSHSGWGPETGALLPASLLGFAV